MLEIIIWDIEAARLMRIDLNMRLAISSLGINAHIICNSEPPLLSRMQLLDKVPVIEIEGNYWSCGDEKDFTKEQLISLLKRFI